MSDRALPQVSLHCCPYLGLKDDEATTAGFAHPLHRCYAQHGAPITMQRQREWCLGSDFRNCRYFPRDDAAAAAIRVPQRQRGRRRLWLLLSLLGLILAGACGVVVWRVTDSLNTNPPAGPQVVVPSPTEMPPLSTPTSTSAPTAEPTPAPSTPAPTTLPATPTLAAPPVVVPTELSTEVTVFAAHGRPADFSDPSSERIWLDTGVVLTGEPVTLTAHGIVTEQPGGLARTPQGLNTEFCQDPVRPCAAPRLSQFALIGSVEDQRFPFLVGHGTTITATGRLFLAFNDGYYEDNCLDEPSACGAWTVLIEGVYALDEAGTQAIPVASMPGR
ncbi:MAG TPA: hypothetical protein VMM78_16020 [Thermomicrobiales bacterium]|nr:hypothetical protein [Thermomicrobiales bacterium]